MFPHAQAPPPKWHASHGHRRVFGFMSLLHGPVMTFAKAAPAHHAVAGGHGDHHHHGTAPQDNPPPIEPGAIPVCYAFGCFVAVQSVAISTPAAPVEIMGTLAPGLSHMMLAADIEPAVPPPRLPV